MYKIMNTNLYKIRTTVITSNNGNCCETSLYYGLCPKCNLISRIETRHVSKYAMIWCCGTYVLNIKFEDIEDSDAEEDFNFDVIEKKLFSELNFRDNHNLVDVPKDVDVYLIPILPIKSIINTKLLIEYDRCKEDENTTSFNDLPYKKQLQYINENGKCNDSYDISQTIDFNIRDSKNEHISVLLQNGIICYFYN